MSSLDKKILKVLKENKVNVAEAADASGAQDQGGTHVKPEYTDLGAAVVSPTQTDHPDYTKGTPSQELRRMDKKPESDISGAKEDKGKVTDDKVNEPGDGPKLEPGKKIVAEDNSLKEAAKKYLKRFNENSGENPFAKKDDDKKDDDKDDDKDDKKDVKEDMGADKENQRQYDKRSEGEPMHHLGTDHPGAEKGIKQIVKEGEVPTGFKQVPADLPGGGMKATDSGNLKEEDIKDLEEDINALFAGEKVTDAFKKKASVIFETAVNTRVQAIVERRQQEIREELQAEMEEAIDEIQEGLSTKVDTYLNYVTEEWVKENSLPIENTIRATIAEDFISGLKTLFENHYIEIPNDKIDVVGTLAAKVEALETKLNEQIETNVEMNKENSTYRKEKVFSTVTEGLATSQIDKLKTLSENVEYKDADTYKKNLEVLRESYFPAKSTKSNTQTLTEEVDVQPIDQVVVGDKAKILQQIQKMNDRPF